MVVNQRLMNAFTETGFYLTCTLYLILTITTLFTVLITYFCTP